MFCFDLNFRAQSTFKSNIFFSQARRAVESSYTRCQLHASCRVAQNSVSSIRSISIASESEHLYCSYRRVLRVIFLSENCWPFTKFRGLPSSSRVGASVTTQGGGGGRGNQTHPVPTGIVWFAHVKHRKIDNGAGRRIDGASADRSASGRPLNGKGVHRGVSVVHRLKKSIV